MSVLVRPLVHSAPGGPTTGITLTLPSVLPDGTLIVVSVGSPNTITAPAGFTALFAELTNGYHFRMWYRFASSDASATYQWTWASTANAELTAALLYDSSGSNLTLGTPVTSIPTSTTTSLPVVTPAQAGSAYLYGVGGANGSGGLSSHTGVNLGAFNLTAMGYYGIAGTSAPGTQVLLSATTSTTWNIGVIEVQSAVAGAAVVVGEGHTASTTASLSGASGSISAQTQNNDRLLALVSARNAGSATTLKPPSDIAYRASTWQIHGTAATSETITLTNFQAGDRAILFFRCGTTNTIGAVPAGWDQLQLDTGVGPGSAYIYTTIIGAGGLNNPGDTITWRATSSGGFAVQLAGFYSLRGGSLSIDASTLTDRASASTALTQAVTTSLDSALLVLIGYVDIGSGPSGISGGNATSLGGTSGYGMAYAYQAVAGESIQYTWSGGTQKWFVGTVALTSSISNDWTLVPNSSVSDITNKISTAVFHRKWATGDLTSYSFLSNNTSGIINVELLTVGNLDATSPVTTAAAQATAGAAALSTPAISPGTSDELTVQFFAGNSTPGAALAAPFDQPPSPIIFGGASNQLSVAVGDVSLCDPQYANTGSHTAAGATVALSLKASTAPTRSTANVRVNQFLLMGAVALATPFSTPPAGASGPSNPATLPRPQLISSLISRIPSQSYLSGVPPPVVVDAPNSAFRLPTIADNFSRFIARIPGSANGDGAGGNLRETQTTAEVVVQGAANLRETQVTAEAVVQDSAILRMTQDTVDVTVRIAEHYRLTQITMDVLIREGPLPPPPPPPPVNPTTSTTPEPSTAIVYSLARQVFEPLQEFTATIRAAVIEASEAGTTWADLPNPWSTYLATWDSFPSKDQPGVFLGLDDGTQIKWSDLPNAWSTYNQSWDSFPAGGNVDLFGDNATTDAGAAIAYSLVPALVQNNSRHDILLDSWDFILKVASFFELVTVEFDSLKQPLSPPVPITATAISLNDKSTYSVSKAYPGPGQNKYSRYIRVTMSGVSFTRAFAFGGATIFVQILERPSN